jgi:hypothetical protein
MTATLPLRSAGNVTDTEFDIQPPPGKAGHDPECRANSQGGLAGQQQAIRTEIQQTDWHRNVQGSHGPAFRRETR